MMQPAVFQSAAASVPPALIAAELPLAPAAMARYLRRTNGAAAALCFAQAIYEDSAWANDDWGAYWADVMRLV